VFRNGERVYLSERCDIVDCGAPPAVCGAPVELVRDLTLHPQRHIDFLWDGRTNFVDSAANCELRRSAPHGYYVARFCYSREAEFGAGGDPRGDVPGRLVRPTCVDRGFTLQDSLVTLTIGGD
jgi:hypothetical protein